jgi:hypothetical protein
MQLSLSEIAAKFGVLPHEPADRFVGLAPFPGVDLDRALDPQQDRAQLGQQHQCW